MPTLYHYTSADGLLGIVDSQTIWATDALYLNDSTEFNYGVELAKGVVASILESLEVTQPTASRILRLFEEGLSGDVFQTVQHPHLACFCRDGDLLSQWRGYAGGVGGYSIGFDGGRLEQHGRGGTYRVVSVMYDPVEQTELLRDSLQVVLQHVSTFSDSEPSDEAQNNINFFLYKQIYELIPQIKLNSFHEENEVRLVRDVPIRFAGTTGVHFRRVGPLLVPFVRLPIADSNGLLPLDEIIVGPNSHPDLAVSSIRRLLQEKGYESVEVRQSSIPLRA